MTEHKKRSNLLWFLLRYVGLLLFVVLMASIDWEEAGRIVQGSDLQWLLLAGALNLAFMILKALRWHALLSIQEVKYGLGRALRVYQAGSFFSVITPGHIGEVVKIAYLKKDIGLKHRVGLSSVLVDRLLDLFTLTGTAILIIMVKSAPEQFISSVVVFAVLLATGCFFIFSAKALPYCLSLSYRLPVFGEALKRKQELFTDAHEALLKFRSFSLIIPIFVSVLAYLAIYLGSWALAHSQQLPLSFIDCAYCIAITSIVSLLPLSVSGIGTRDIGMVIMFSYMNLGREQALIFSLSYLLVNLIFANSLGAIFWFTEPINIKKEEGLPA